MGGAVLADQNVCLTQETNVNCVVWVWEGRTMLMLPWMIAKS